MSFGRTLGFGIRSRKNVTPDLRRNLPEVNSFVEISIGGSAKRESVAIDDIRPTQIVTRLAGKMVVGTDADFLYITPEGRFRFLTVCRARSRRLNRSLTGARTCGSRWSCPSNGVTPATGTATARSSGGR
jgi:hypothetical protein